MLANLIEKYAAVLDIDNLPEPPNCLGKETAGAANAPEQTEDTIEKAKALLIRYRYMTEEQAHRYLQKRSMETSSKMAVTAKTVIAEFE